MRPARARALRSRARMERWTLIEAADAVRLPWRNGRGVTRQLALWPPDARFAALDFEWRVSAAGVVEDGAFSDFPGYDRVLVVTAGEGLVLDHGDARGRARLRPLEPYAFSGDLATWAALVGGPVEDFGVMTRRGAWRAEVQVLRLGARRARFELGPGEHGLAHALAGEAALRLEGEEDELPLTTGDTAWVLPARGGADAEVVGLEPGTTCVTVRLVPE